MDENPYEGQTLYSAEELKQIIYGLLNVYWSKHWLIRWLYKPWHDALQTLALIVCPEEIQKDIERADALKSVDDILNR